MSAHWYTRAVWDVSKLALFVLARPPQPQQSLCGSTCAHRLIAKNNVASETAGHETPHTVSQCMAVRQNIQVREGYMSMLAPPMSTLALHYRGVSPECVTVCSRAFHEHRSRFKARSTTAQGCEANLKVTQRPMRMSTRRRARSHFLEAVCARSASSHAHMPFHDTKHTASQCTAARQKSR